MTTRRSRRSTAEPATTRSRSARSTASSAIRSPSGRAARRRRTARRALRRTRHRTHARHELRLAQPAGHLRHHRDDAWLARAGASQPLVAVGDIGDDIFTVYSNQAPLRLEGGDGNDLFMVRGFALAQTYDHGGNPATGAPCDPNNPAFSAAQRADCEIVWINAQDQIAMPKLTSGFSTAAESDIRTGAGTNQVEYNMNAPVSVDGGNGFDKLVILGTEYADHIVVTSTGDLRRRRPGDVHEHRGARDRRTRGRRHDRHPLDGARRRDARHRRPRQRHARRRRRRHRRRLLARRRGHERHDQPRCRSRATRTTTASSPTAST